MMIAANCNTVFHSISFNKKQKLVAYGAANTVLIMDPYYINNNVPKVLFSLKGHEERVNSVSWLTDEILVSVSSDKSLIIWGYDKGTNPRNPLNWKHKKVFKEAHKETINYLSTFSYLPESVGENGQKDTELYILSMCSSGTLKFWQGINEVQAIDFRAELLFGKNLQEAMSLTIIGEKNLVLVVGGYDVNIHVYLIPRIQYQEKEDKKLFKYKFSLLGHFNSLRDFAFTDLLEKNIRYLASSAQDGNIRLWKIQPLENVSESLGGHEGEDELRQFESKKSYVLKDDLEIKVYNITLESVLASHQESVSSVCWGLREGSQKVNELKDLCLLSASFDFSVCLWKEDPDTEIWSVESTLGAMTGNKHAYFGALFLEDDQKILAYTYNGALHQWRKIVEKSEGEEETSQHQWVTQMTVKGHFGEISDLDWDQNELNLATTSQDQTTRIFSQYKENLGWFEFSRPQVHGYDMNTLAFVKVNGQNNLPSKILSGGDEKVLRLFESPYSFVKTFNSLHPDAKSINLRYNDQKTNEEIEKLISSEGAKKQPLGLMNKPVMLANEKMRVDEEESGGMNVGEFDPTKFLSNNRKEEIQEQIAEPPEEDILMVRTLWPEVQKLYGHAFEVFCVAVTLQGDCAASACKAKDKKYADIAIWDLRKGQSTVPSCRLSVHTLTVVQIEFSKCGQFMISCSRDRTWAIFQRLQDTEKIEFKLLKKQKDAHTRIIWGINFSHDDGLFVTASREKQKSVKVWNGVQNLLKNEQFEIGTLHSELPEENPSATAVRFFPNLVQSSYSLIVGLESGDMIIWSQFDTSKNKEWKKIYVFPQYLNHCAPVRRMKFNARLSNKEKDEYVLASGGNDNTVRLFRLKLTI